MFRSRRLGLILTALLLVLSICTLLLYQHATTGLNIAQMIKSGRGRCESELDPLRRHLKLPSKISYARRRVQAKPVENFKQRSIIHLEQNLLAESTHLNLNDRACSLPESGDPLIIEYPDFTPASKIDTSALMFGVSTSLKRLREAIPHMARWLGNSSASIVIDIDDSDDYAELENVQDLAEASGINAELIQNLDTPKGGDRHAQRHFDIIKALHQHRGKDHRWFGVVDDDTFFPSLPALLDALDQYDSSKPCYIGSLSESWDAVARHFGYMAYGGAGIFLSRPLLDAVYEKFDACKAPGFEGDAMYRDCIYQHISPPVQLTRMDGLHQVDVRIDVSGWYEGGIKPILSLHHFNGWHHFPVEVASLVTDVCGHDCFLQRYQFADDVVLTNAYSIARYPRGVQSVDLDRIEGTFAHEKEEFDFSLGALRPPVNAEDKISFRLDYAIQEDNGNVRQFYVKRKGHAETDDERMKLEIESVFELEWSR